MNEGRTVVALRPFLALERHFPVVHADQARVVQLGQHGRLTTTRSNTDLAIAVDPALLLAQTKGAWRAAAFLEANGARFALTCRVLAEPARRRLDVGWRKAHATSIESNILRTNKLHC